MTLKPPIHGRDHLPGGADPIPSGCCPEGCITLADIIERLAVDSNLLGYWRLGEAAGDFADTSGQANPADATVGAGAVALTRDVTGALSAEQDDGAIRLNDSDGDDSEFLEPNSGGDGARFNLTNDDMTIIAFVKPIASGSSFEGGIIGNYTTSGGWSLMVEWPTLTPIFVREDGAGVTLVGPGIDADEWVMLVATYDSVNGHLLYYNGVQVDADPTILTGLPAINQDPVIGLAGEGLPSIYRSFYGSLDEISVWGSALTPQQIAEIWEGRSCSPAQPGQVITAGEDGNEWAYPTIAVDDPEGRYDTLNLGAGLTGTDEFDGSITINATATAPADDTSVWMPLTTVVGGDPELVWDGDDSLIPTLTPI